jgi:hypothetical protein
MAASGGSEVGTLVSSELGQLPKFILCTPGLGVGELKEIERPLIGR